MKLGIDIGGTTINIGKVRDGVLVSKSTMPSFPKDATLEETEEYLISMIKDNLSEDVDMIGIGVPSVVDVGNGIVYNAANIPSWTEIHLKKDLQAAVGLPVRINNDANCYALGAAREIGVKDDEIFVCVTLGTGVGIGVVSGGHILNGANTGFGELTWVPYNGKPVEYWCGKSFFAEQGIDPALLAAKAEKGDGAALRQFAEYGRHLAVLLGIVISAYDPHKIVFGGGLSNANQYFESAMMNRLEKIFPFPESLKNLDISYLPQSDAAIVGASLL